MSYTVHEFYEAFSKHQTEEQINDVRLTPRYHELITLFPPISEKRKRNLTIIVPRNRPLSDLNTNARSFTPSPKTNSPKTPSFFDFENSPVSLLENKKRIYRKRK
jgi:hypothetical protein